ncbi:MAG: ATP-grasp domain-containing protein [Candidatus Aminicenantes bacterium]|nr:ATP-grasp domain-containing protein [Candidatus Aminicenantes bacterium]
MATDSVKVGVAFNTYEPFIYRPEKVSEDSVARVAEVVCESLNQAGVEASLVPLQRSMFTFLRRLKELNVEVVINLCEGFFGNPQWEANVAAVMEMLNIPFTGNGSRTLALCQDKHQAKAILSSFNLPVAPSQLITSAEEMVELKFPVIVKPNSEDASVGVHPESVVHDSEALAARVEKIVKTYNQPAIVEKYIEGREFNVAVMEDGEPQALPISEIDFSKMPEGYPHICSYEAKWYPDHILYKASPPICPARINKELSQTLQEIAVTAFKVMGCRDYARVDFRMNQQGEVFILEVNPNPDISLDAGYVRALKAAGIEYAEFWKLLINNARKRKEGHDAANGKS